MHPSIRGVPGGILSPLTTALVAVVSRRVFASPVPAWIYDRVCAFIISCCLRRRGVSRIALFQRLSHLHFSLYPGPLCGVGTMLASSASYCIRFTHVAKFTRAFAHKKRTISRKGRTMCLRGRSRAHCCPRRRPEVLSRGIRKQ